MANKAKEDLIKCMYCGKERPPKDIKYVRIWSPNWKASGGRSPSRPYCKDTACAIYDQMAHEG